MHFQNLRLRGLLQSSFTAESGPFFTIVESFYGNLHELVLKFKCPDLMPITKVWTDRSWRKMSRKMTPKTFELAPSVRSAPRSRPEAYSAFDQIDGRHPWQSAVPDGFVPYPVRRLERGKVVYFNFSLAREMGLLPADHPDQLTPALTRKLLDTFSIQIINEYDQQKGGSLDKTTLKPHPHMATRYLQLQHANKQGRTSGDGRSIWNGLFKHHGQSWDISSRGTGVTCLSPGAVEANRPLKTGATEFGYGCGLADITELYGSTVMSEIFHLNGVHTERMLVIIDLGKGCGIGVRAAQNLIRPAHLFLYLKQGRLEPLRQATDYLIRRQTENRMWRFSPTSPDRHRLMLKEIALSFARFAAKLEREYIFAWLDWDGDNVLASGGIIDYGSIRQFGLRHDQYRYDDIQRYSTNLNEQKGKARLTVQVFAQLVHFLETGKRRPLRSFENHASVREFDREFERELRKLFLSQVGFSDKQIEALCKQGKSVVEPLYQSFLALEKWKTTAGLKRLPDGVNRPAIFNMRKVLRDLPEAIFNASEPEGSMRALPAEEMMELMASSFAKKADLRLRPALREKIARFQKAYLRSLKVACDDQDLTAFIRDLAERAQDTNRAGRITGNGSEFIVDALLRARKRGLAHSEIQAAIDLFVSSQAPKVALQKRPAKPVEIQSNVGRLFQELVNIAHEFEEDI